jgi:secreted Zn-dependent insulinase-like peptidase
MVVREFRNMVNKEYTVSNEQLIASLAKISPTNMMAADRESSGIGYHNFRKYAIELMSKGNVIGVFGGSISLDLTKKIIKVVDDLIDIKRESAIRYSLPTTLFSAKKVVYNENPHNNENAIGYGLYIGNTAELPDTKWYINKPMITMLSIYISDKFSSQIRTQQEVGYIAHCQTVNVGEANNPEIFLVFVVQSTRKDLEHVVQDYVDTRFLADVQTMSNDEFLNLKNSMLTSLEEKPKNIIEDINQKLSDIEMDVSSTIKGSGPADRRKQMIEGLKVIDKKMFVSFATGIYEKNLRSIINIEAFKNRQIGRNITVENIDAVVDHHKTKKGDEERNIYTGTRKINCPKSNHTHSMRKNPTVFSDSSVETTTESMSDSSLDTSDSDI